MINTKSIDLDRLVYEGAVKPEITRGVPTWEASHGMFHQRTIDRIRASIELLAADEGEYECIHVSDVLIRFKDGSLKRPDIAIFCTEPPEPDEALEIVPQAVIEVISPGYEYKDLELNPQFYLGQGVNDVIIVDPRAGMVLHHRATGTTRYDVPVTLELECGCRCTIPARRENR